MKTWLEWSYSYCMWSAYEKRNIKGVAKTLHKDTKRVYKFITACIEKYGRYPSVKMLKDKFNLDPKYYLKTGYTMDQTADHVRNWYVKNEVQTAMNHLQLMLGDDELHSPGDYVKVMSSLQSYALEDNNASAISTKDYREILRYYSSGEAEKQAAKFGFPTLDEITGGICEGEYIIIYANVSEGKSTFARAIAGNMVKQGKSILYFTLEESGRKSVVKTLATMAQFSQNEILDGRMSMQTFSKIKSTMASVEGSVTFVDRIESDSIADLMSMLNTGKYDICIVDQIPLMTQNGDADWQEITKITRQLKRITQSTKIPCIALTQEQRKGKKGKLEGLAYAHSIAQDADKVLYLHPDDPDGNPGVKKGTVAKNRDRERYMDFYLTWRPDIGLITDEATTLHPSPGSGNPLIFDT